jgi:hypothetical protein
MYIRLQAKYSTCYSCQILMRLEFSRQFFEEYSNSKFNENPSTRSRVVPCGHAEGRTDTDMTNPTVAFRYFAKGSKNGEIQTVY